MVLAPLGLAQYVLFEDDFNDGNADGWFEYASGASYEVNDSLRYEISYLAGLDTFGFSYRGDNGMTMSEENYSVLVESIGHSPTTHWGVTLRYVEATGTAYALYVGQYWDTYYIGRYDSFLSFTVLGTVEPYPGGFNHLTPYWIRFECDGDILRGKIWEGLASAEPVDWMIVRVDDTYQNNGCVGLDACNEITDNLCTEFDNVVVTGSVSLDNTTWGAIKSAF